MTNATATPRTLNYRLIGWSIAAALLLAPAIAMQFTREVNWTPSDFVVMGGLIGGIGLMLEFLARRSRNTAYRVASGLMLLGCLLLIWINLAVGIIGNEDNPANLMFAAVLATIAGGAIVSHFRPAGMKRTTIAAAMVQLLVGIAAFIGRMGASESPIWPREVIVLSLFFAALWLIAAALFGKAAQD